MSALFSLIGRRHFLASAAVGAIGACLPVSAANAATTPVPPAAETVAPVPTATASLAATAGETSVIGAATAEQSGDTAIRPFKYHASDAELVDLKRRIQATKWPDRETVNDTTQGVRLATMQKLADYW